MSAISQTIASTVWLDEELRRQKAMVAQLRDTVEKQQLLLADQAHRSLALEDRLVKVQGELLHIADVEEALRNTRDELVLMFSDLRQDLRKRDAKATRSHQAEREQDAQVIQEIQVELSRFDQLDEVVSLREAEERRLNECILRLEQTLEETLERLSREEEAKRQLADRIERNALELGQLEEVLAEAQPERQELASRILSLEAALPQLHQRMAELQAMRTQLTRQQEDLLESQKRAESERARALTDWRRQIESAAHQMETWAEQLRYFSDQHEKNRRVLREVEDLARQVSQQQDQLRQVQHIAEDRLRHEFREWRGQNDRRWAQELQVREKADQAQEDRNASYDQRLTSLEEERKEDLIQMAALREQLDALALELRTEDRKLRQAHFTALERQAEGFRTTLETLRELWIGEETPG